MCVHMYVGVVEGRDESLMRWGLWVCSRLREGFIGSGGLVY